MPGKKNYSANRGLKASIIAFAFVLFFSGFSFGTLYLMVDASTAYTCNLTTTMSYDFYIYNTGPTAVPVNTLSIEFWYKSAVNLPSAYVNNVNDQRTSDNQTNIGASVAWSAYTPVCPDANIQALMTFSGTATIPVGGYLKINGAAHLGSYAILDPECDDYSKIGLTTQHNDPHFGLYNSGVPVDQTPAGYPMSSAPCAIPSPTNTPTTVGKLNCVTDSNGNVSCAFVALNGNTPTVTPTYTMTDTRTMTPTYTATFTSTTTPTYTSTYTMTYTRTNTPTYT